VRLLDPVKPQRVAGRFFGCHDFPMQNVESAAQLIKIFLAAGAGTPSLAPEALAVKWKRCSAQKKTPGPSRSFRRFSDALIEVCRWAQNVPRHEMRWLSLSGFCLRPGFGAPVIMRSSTACEPSPRTTLPLKTICNVRSECWCCCVGSC